MKPRFLRILWNDWLSLFFTAGIFVAPVIAVIFPFVRKGAQTPYVTAWVLMAICAGLLLWRLIKISWFFRYGVLVKGVVSDLKLVRDRGKLEYLYEVGGCGYGAWCAVHRTKTILTFRPQMIIEVLADPKNPRHSLVKGLFD